MGLSLGIHVGHHASCAVVRDGVLVSAIQLERLTRRKYHTVGSLTNALPIEAVLRAAGATIDDVDVIVSSFQGGSIAGFGLHQPLIDAAFDIFDPFSSRHRVLSHHLAHAYCAAAYAPAEPLAVIISDYGGSATIDGADYESEFAPWFRTLTSARTPVTLKTECLTIYRGSLEHGFEVRHREFFIPHSQPRSFVHSVATLYENVTNAVFHKGNAHGQLMALAAYGASAAGTLREQLGAMVTVRDEEVTFHNDWQHAVFGRTSFDEIATLAERCQTATEDVLLAYARRAARESSSRHLALAGGTFLNILGNTRLAASGLFDTVSLPSAPHDAGIAVGCAIRGARVLGDQIRRVETDRLGPRYTPNDIDAAVRANARFVKSRPADVDEIAALLAGGAIVARSAGRAEFGPRALGGRSLLASPLSEVAKDRLNQLKGRQPWRPVAPIVREAGIAAVFDGPGYSPWMTFSHAIREPHVSRLPALHHPDGSTRAQTLSPADDPWLDELLLAFERLTGYPVLVNTSFNGPAEPIIETPSQAVRWFLEHRDVDVLLLDDVRVERRPVLEALDGAFIAPSTDLLVTQAGRNGTRRLIATRGEFSAEVSSPKLQAMLLGAEPIAAATLATDDAAAAELYQLCIRGAVECRS